MLGRGVAFAGAVGTCVGPSVNSAAAEPLSVPQWSKEPGAPFVGYGQPSKFEAGVARATFNPPNEPGSGVAFAPIHLLDGMITPNGLHFERSHTSEQLVRGTHDISAPSLPAPRRAGAVARLADWGRTNHQRGMNQS